MPQTSQIRDSSQLSTNNQTRNNSNISISNNLQALVYTLQTTQMLKMLTKIFPTIEWNSDWLHGSVRRNGSYTFQQGVVLIYKGQPSGSNTQHFWEIRVDSRFAEKVRAYYDLIVNNELALIPIQERTSNNSEYPYSLNGLNFRSKAEQELAKALEKRGVLFFANSKCRIRNRLNQTETKETDFLVFYKGNARIIEVDGQEHHQDRSKDYRRDRMFDKEGIISTRFSANECLKNADEVVEEFLELFGGHSKVYDSRQSNCN